MKLGRRVLALTAVACLGAPHTLARADAPAIQRIERLEAEFLYKVARKRYVEYAAVAKRATDVASGHVIAVSVAAGLRRCRLKDETLSCRGPLVDQEVVRFDASDDLSVASLVFRDSRRRNNRLRLVANDPYQATGRSIPNECGGATVLAYEYAFNATATGTMFGRRVQTSRDADPESETLTRYVEVKACP